MAVPERELVDNALARAKTLIDELPSARDKAVGRLAYSLTEALVRQIRDADDTVATTLSPMLNENLVDLTQVIGENLSSLTTDVKRIAERVEQHNGKGGLFG